MQNIIMLRILEHWPSRLKFLENTVLFDGSKTTYGNSNNRFSRSVCDCHTFLVCEVFLDTLFVHLLLLSSVEQKFSTLFLFSVQVICFIKSVICFTESVICFTQICFTEIFIRINLSCGNEEVKSFLFYAFRSLALYHWSVSSLTHIWLSTASELNIVRSLVWLTSIIF